MQRLGARLTGGVLVALLHIPLIAALISVNLASGIRPIIAEEPHPIDVMLPAPPLPRRAAAPIRGAVQNGAGHYFSPDMASPYFSPPASAPTIAALLFGCVPENLRNLTRAEQDKCLRLASGRYDVMKDGLAVSVKPPGPEWEGLRNSDLRARERNTADPCMAAKATGTECIHEILYGKHLW